jgi:predicted metal-dependent phosphoesterase TrpH
MHSTVSDGWRDPDEVAHLAADRGVRVMALTDHDTFLGVERARTIAHRRGLGYVPALEVTT